MTKYTFLIPLYNDWNNLKILLEKIEFQIQNLNFEFEMIVLNDFSSVKHDISAEILKKIKELKIINLRKNIGSQRAIAIGLKYILENSEETEERMIITMDSDGQDDPAAINKLIELSQNQRSEIITVDRTRRNEPIWFKVLYEIHYLGLILFSGRKIRYGNYGLINRNKIKKLLIKGDVWSAYPAAISNNFKEIKKVFSERKKRFSGNTKMNLYKLIIHSIRVYSVFKYKVLFFSLFYSSFLLLISPLFYFLIAFLLISNFLIFKTSMNNKKKFEESYKTIIKDIETVKK